MKLSAVLRARDHGLRVLYSAGTARTKRALWAGASGMAPSLLLRLPFDYGTMCQCTHIGHRHLVMDKQSSLVSGDIGEEERIGRQASVPGIEPGPSDWESSAPSGKPLPGTEVCLLILLICWQCSLTIQSTSH